METKHILTFVFVIFIFLGCDPVDKDEEYSGGAATIFNSTYYAFNKPILGLSFEERATFETGDSLFNKSWVIAPASTTARDGLGPLFNARSCSGCHSRDGRGRPPKEKNEVVTALLFRLSIPGETENNSPKPHPIYGGQLNNKAVPGVEPEGKEVIKYSFIKGTFADGTPYELRKPEYSIENLKYGELSKDIMISPRVAPMIPGLGLLEQVSEETILGFADPEDKDKDGISGKANYVWDVTHKKKRLGRFGWKANQPSLLQQNAGAFNGDIGITSPLFPRENHSDKQTPCLDIPSGGTPEISAESLERITFYTQHLAMPGRRNWKDPTVVTGKKLFLKAECHLCHIPKMQTSTSKDFPKLSQQKIRPFTDLLLHDMGEGLADNRPDFEANGREWRTSPLWGIGLVEKVNYHTFFLHDGRARNLQEAILWHGGESKKSMEIFKAFSKEERKALLAFLNSL
ncbi:di-heme oxidoredictase family protein [Candidatus Uabimicrobium sp. HlEnr_7]|uniref:di-heme oxidoreductase family protein n=1 Tax=Candidatus Uabimicrobium helgolandensis TaxID=3095367 RepID=UPI0035588EA8